MNIFIRELKANRKALVIWTTALALFVIMIIYVYPSFGEQGEMIDQYSELFPEAMKKAFGIDRIKMSDPLGFYAVEAYSMIVLFGGIFAAILGSGLLAKEEDEKTVEFLLAKPITRSQVLTGKLLTYITYMAAFNLFIGIATFASFEYFYATDYSRSTLAVLLVAPFFAHLTFASLGFASSLFFTRKKSVVSVSTGMVVGLYFLSIIAAISEKLEFLAYFTPLKYVDGVDIVINQQLNWGYISVLLAVNLVLIGTTYLLYRRRDILV